MALRILARQCTNKLHNNGTLSFVRFVESCDQSSVEIAKGEEDAKILVDQKMVPTEPITVSTIEDVGLASAIPQEHIRTRMVRIYKPSKNAMQSGTNNIHYWQIEFDTRERWENPLMGWASSGDPMSNIKLDFANVEAAIQHCEKMGWKYYIQQPNIVNPKPRSYGANFAWNKRTRVSTK